MCAPTSSKGHRTASVTARPHKFGQVWPTLASCISYLFAHHMDLLFGPDEEKLGLRQEVERLKAENERLKAESTAPAASPSPPKPIALNSRRRAQTRRAAASPNAPPRRTTDSGYYESRRAGAEAERSRESSTRARAGCSARSSCARRQRARSASTSTARPRSRAQPSMHDRRRGRPSVVGFALKNRVTYFAPPAQSTLQLTTHDSGQS